jgi:hypothetical protein
MVAVMLRIIGSIALGLALVWSALQVININGWPVSGPVSERMVREIDLVTRLGVRKLSVQSSGGHVELGLDIAEIIQNRNIAVNVVGFCASACVNYIFLVSKRRQISPDGVLLMHGDIENTNRFIMESGLPLGPLATRAGRRYANILDAHPEGDAIRYLLRTSFEDLRPIETQRVECSPEDVRDGRVLCYFIRAGHSLWVPSASDLSTLNVNISRQSPMHYTEAALRDLLACEIGYRRPRIIIYKGETVRIDPEACDR